jgi:hypothetical protein
VKVRAQTQPPASHAAEASKPKAKSHAAEEVEKFVKDFGTGFVLDAKETAVGLKDTGVGIWKMTAGALIDPEDAAHRWKLAGKVATQIIKHPMLLPKALVHPFVESWQAGHPGDAVGRLAFEIATTLAVGEVMHKFAGSLSQAGNFINFAANSSDDIARAASRLGFVAEQVAEKE